MTEPKIIELGGGNNPVYHPNVDVRSGPSVDIVFDFDTLDGTQHMPIEDGSYDVVHSRFAIEHISWRCTKNLIAEIFRILKRDGAAVVIAPNTFEQCKVISERGYWIENDSCMLFGEQNYGENSHKAGWSMDYLAKMFREAGFNRVYTERFALKCIQPDGSAKFPDPMTDMILVAEKGDARIVDENGVITI